MLVLLWRTEPSLLCTFPADSIDKELGLSYIFSRIAIRPFAGRILDFFSFLICCILICYHDLLIKLQTYIYIYIILETNSLSAYMETIESKKNLLRTDD